MKVLISLFLIGTLFMGAEDVSIDFGTKKVNQGWYVVNDGVMGGLSQGNITYTDDGLLFEGNISLENNGGFSRFISGRTDFNLQDYNAIEIRIKADARKYAFVLQNTQVYYRPTWRVEFTGNGQEWQTIRMPLEDFNKAVMARPTGQKMNPDMLSSIRWMGIILYDKKSGPFKMELDYIKLVQ